MLVCKGFAFLVWSTFTCVPVGASPDTFCEIAEPIFWVSADTRETKEQIDRLNRKGKRVCGWGSKGGAKK
jgi:hypothetical protein